jgi:parallel beta-helix repeat protein
MQASTIRVPRTAVALGLAAMATLGLPAEGNAAAPATITVRTTIQEAVDRATPGATVVVPAGTYRETVLVTKPGLTIRGRPGAVLDGAGLGQRTGIRVRPLAPATTLAGFTLDGMVVRNFDFTGVLVSDVDGFRLTGTRYADNAEYGPFPIRSSGRVDHNVVTGSDDSGIYVGQSTGVVIDHNLAQRNTIGIEVELSTAITVEDNVATDNSVGALVQIVPGLTRTATKDVTVRRNVFSRNDRPNPVTDPDEILSLLPSGIGILSLGADDVRINDNVVTGNPTIGVGVISLPPDAAAQDPRLEPAPDRNAVQRNVIAGNGRSPDPTRPSPLAGVDVGWDGTGTGNCFTTGPATRSLPAHLPPCR